MTLDQDFFKRVDTSMFGIPKNPGVYAICLSNYRYNVENPKEIILYIGSSKNLNSRLNQNNHYYKMCYEIFEEMAVYTRCFETHDYISVEKKLISIYKPLLNKQGKKNA